MLSQETIDNIKGNIHLYKSRDDWLEAALRMGPRKLYQRTLKHPPEHGNARGWRIYWEMVDKEEEVIQEMAMQMGFM